MPPALLPSEKREKKYWRAPLPWALQVWPDRPLAARRRGAEMRARRSRRDGAGSGVMLRGCARSGGDLPRVPPGLPHAGPAAGGSGSSCPGRRVWPRTPRPGCAAPSPSAFPELANTSRSPAARGSSGLLGTKSGQVDPI